MAVMENIRAGATNPWMKAVFAAIAGAWLLGESLELRGYFGCALMFAGMLLAQLWPKKLAH